MTDFDTKSDPFSQLDTLDKHKIFEAICAQPNQLLGNYADSMAEDIVADTYARDGRDIRNIVLAGMGGSALAGEIARNWLASRLSLPFEVVRQADLPAYVDDHSLVFISSASGNTAETLAALGDAARRDANIIIMTSGGELPEIAEMKHYRILHIPPVTQPRFGVFSDLRALACVLQDLELSGGIDLRRELEDVANWLNAEKFALTPEAQGDNIAKTIALQLRDQPVIVYGTPLTAAAAYKWKIDINENAKQLAWSNVYSELNHNEFQGWIFPAEKHFAAVQLVGHFDSEAIQKRVRITTEMLGEHGFEPILPAPRGETPLQQLLYFVLLGDFVSAYLGILNGIDPTPVDMVEDFKKRLEQ